ncbi:Rop family plasmid primer RNA-binding protein [Enterobacter hormaechei]|jgi:hypothetical protein
MTKQEKTTLNMAKFIKAQSLLLLEKIDELDLDTEATVCEHLHEHAEALFKALETRFEFNDIMKTHGAAYSELSKR